VRALITGGSGFIGCNAAVGFTSRGYEVLCVDNHSRPLVQRNAEWLRAEHEVPTENLDMRGREAAESVVQRFQPNVVLHCAGQVAVTSSVGSPRRDFEDNALGTFNVLEAVRLFAPDAIVLYPSTNKVYGAMDDVGVETRDGRYCYSGLPFGCPENRPLDFHSPYGCSKGAADQYVRDYSRIYGLRTVVFRQSCIYGYRQFGLEDQGWVAWFAIRAAQAKPITIYGDGRQVRDVLFIQRRRRSLEPALPSRVAESPGSRFGSSDPGAIRGMETRRPEGICVGHPEGEGGAWLAAPDRRGHRRSPPLQVGGREPRSFRGRHDVC
jgi:CDP-paratose 2-epimerase